MNIDYDMINQHFLMQCFCLGLGLAISFYVYQISPNDNGLYLFSMFISILSFINQPFLMQCFSLGLGLTITFFVYQISLKHAQGKQAIDYDNFNEVKALALKGGSPFNFSKATKFHDNEEIVTLFINNNGNALGSASPRLQAKRELLMMAVQRPGDYLRSTSLESRDDFDVVMASVSFKGTTIQYASNRLRKNFDIALVAFKNNVNSIYYIDDELLDDFLFGLLIVNISPFAIAFLSERLRNNIEIAMAVLIRCRSSVLMFYVGDTLRNDLAFNSQVLGRLNSNIKFVNSPVELLANKNIIKEIAELNGSFLVFANDEIRGHFEIGKEAIKCWPKDLAYVSFEFLCANLDIVEPVLTKLSVRFIHESNLSSKLLAAKSYNEKKQVLLLDIKHIKLVSVIKNYDAKLADLDATINELRHCQASSKLSDFSFLSNLAKHFKNNSHFDVLIKQIFVELSIDINIENMYKLLPLEDFTLFELIYNIYLRELFDNCEVYPGHKEKIKDYANDYANGYFDGYPECYVTTELAFHVLNGYPGTPLTKNAHKFMLGSERHAYEERVINESDLLVLDDQKLKCCNRALIYGFKIHTLDVLYKEDPKSPLIIKLLTTFNEEEKTKSEFKAFQEKLNSSSTMSVSMFEDKEIEQNGIASNLAGCSLNK